MKITVITATNLEPKYLECAPIFVKFWLSQSERSGNQYRPLVIVIAAEMPQELEAIQDYCVLHPAPTGVSDVFSSQFIRALYAPMIKSDFVLTSDVDMLTLSTRVFDYVLEATEYSRGTFSVCRDVLDLGQYPICYNLATPKIWSSVTGVASRGDIDSILVESFHEAYSRNKGYEDGHGAKGWFTDQEFLFRQVEKFKEEGGLVRSFTDRQTKHRRLDRIYTGTPLNWIVVPLVFLGFLTDYHVHHPVRKFRRYISTVHWCLQSGVKFRQKLGRFLRFE
jgi:hypothetical protein